MNTLFELEPVTPRLPSGRFATKAVKAEFDRMRSTIVMLTRQRQSVWMQLREKDEEINRLKQMLHDRI